MADGSLDLWFSGDAMFDHELDAGYASSWVRDPIDEIEADPLVEEFGIPLEPASAPATEVWNLVDETSPVTRLAAAAALVPMLLCGAPALAAPPTGASVEAPAMQPSSPAEVWAALTDRHVVLSLADGSSFRGTVLSVRGNSLICAREADGLVVAVDAAQVVAAHVVPDKPDKPAKPPQTGQGMIVFGTIATAIGGALAIGTLVTGAACGRSSSPYSSDFCPYYTIPIGVLSAINLSVGIPFVAAGVRKRKRYREAQAAENGPQISGFVAPGRDGVMAGVGVRF